MECWMHLGGVMHSMLVNPQLTWEYDGVVASVC